MVTRTLIFRSESEEEKAFCESDVPDDVAKRWVLSNFKKSAGQGSASHEEQQTQRRPPEDRPTRSETAINEVLIAQTKSFQELQLQLTREHTARLENLDKLTQTRLNELAAAVGGQRPDEEYRRIQEMIRTEYTNQQYQFETHLLRLETKIREEKMSDEYLCQIKQVQDLQLRLAREQTDRLEETIAKLQQENAVLKNSNQVKGKIGENLIANSLRQMYKDADVTDVGKQPGTCDVRFERGNLVLLFESKYKQTIQTEDVTKFVRDAQQQAINGAVFVSLLTSAIPKKGPVHFEIDDSSERPLLFLGFDDVQEFEAFFPRYVNIFFALCSGLHVSTSQPQWQKVAANLQAELGQLRQQRDAVVKFKKQSIDFLANMEASLSGAVDRLATLCEECGIQSQTSISEDKPECLQCKKKFANQKTLATHTAKCKQLT